MFCAIATIIDRCKTEGVVDVFQVVKALRVQKPGAVPTLVSHQCIVITSLWRYNHSLCRQITRPYLMPHLNSWTHLILTQIFKIFKVSKLASFLHIIIKGLLTLLLCIYYNVSYIVFGYSIAT